MRPAGSFNQISYTTGPAGVYIRFHRIPFVFTLQDTAFRFPDEDAGYPVISENTENALCSFLPGTQGVFSGRSGLLLYSFASYDECFSSSVLRRLMNVSALRRSDAKELRPESDFLFLFRSVSAKPLSVTGRHVFADDPLDMRNRFFHAGRSGSAERDDLETIRTLGFCKFGSAPLQLYRQASELECCVIVFRGSLLYHDAEVKTNFFRRYSIWNWERK